MNILVVGGGISGISAAKVALKEGHSVTILEQSPDPGGLMARIANCRVGFKTFFDEVREAPGLTVRPDISVQQAERSGDVFRVHLLDGTDALFDRVIIASGLSPYDPAEYKGRRVITSLEYDALIDQRNAELPPSMNRVAFVLCVGSRSKEYPLCSSVCCSYTIREIKWTLQRGKPQITVFYNDLRLFGQEFFMEKAFRDMGVRFVRSNSRSFEEDEEGVTVRYFSGGRSREERFDHVVLAIGLRPNPTLRSLSHAFGFSLNPYGFIAETEALKTDVPGIYACGGALEPMTIKDAILTGYGAAMRAVRENHPGARPLSDRRIYEEPSPPFPSPDAAAPSYLFYLGSEDAANRMLSEFISHSFITLARELTGKGKQVTVVTRNMVMPSYGELFYEEARRDGVLFLHLEEDQTISFQDGKAIISGAGPNTEIDAAVVVPLDDYARALGGKDFLIQYRSEPQLRWSPTKWERQRFNIGFIRYPRSERWRDREFFGALGEITVDEEGDRTLPEVNEDRCSGCGSCRNACPHDAIEILVREKPLSLFGPHTTAAIPIAHVKEDACVSCGLCAATCPSDVIVFPEAPTSLTKQENIS